MIKDFMIIKRAINNTLMNAYEEGQISPDENGDLRPELLWPWSVSQVVGLHTHMKGVGDDVWFRLIDGTVWNAYGDQEVRAKDEDFDTVQN